MSYSMRGFAGPSGDGEAECQDFYSGGVEHCLGYEESCPDGDKCCPPDTWYNWVYRDIKGDNTARADAESKVRMSGALLLSPDASGETAMQLFAYDAGVTIAPLLVEAITRSFALFEVAFPEQRFNYDAKHRETDCGWYDGWDQDSRYWYPARFEALERGADVSLSETFKTLVLERGMANYTESEKWRFGTGEKRVVPGGEIGAWLDRGKDVIYGAPGAQPQQYVTAQPKIGDLLLVDPAGNIQPSTWLQHFISVFLPKRQPKGARAVAQRAQPTPWDDPPQQRWEVIPTEPRTSRPGLSGVALAGASALAFGLGYVVARKVFR